MVITSLIYQSQSIVCFYSCSGAGLVLLYVMSFSDIASIPEKFFKKYWSKIVRDPHFTSVVKKLTYKESKKKQNLRGLKALWHRIKNFGFYRGVITKLKSIRSAMDFQKFMLTLVSSLIKRTSEGLTVSGLSNITDLGYSLLDIGKSEILKSQIGKTNKEQEQIASASGIGICFLSSHRSTALDPTLTSFVLRHYFAKGVHNAAGDNIFKTPWLGDLIRLNRGFMVKREVEDMDEKIAEARRLSGYIDDLNNQGEWVWIAHRNGRAKDGNDLTDSAVPSMLKMALSETSDWQDFARTRALMPIAMSWEMIPLDNLMAQELNGLLTHKGKHRDMQNIFSEIKLKKKRIHIHYAKRIDPDTISNRKQLVKAIDNGIHSGTRLWEANWLAWLRNLRAQDADGADQAAKMLLARVDLSKAAWLPGHIEKHRAQTLAALESGDLDLNMTPAQPQEKSLPERADDVARSLWSMYAAVVENAIQSLGSLSAVLDYQDALQLDCVSPR